MKDARGRYEVYLNKKSLLTSPPKLNLDALKKLEIEKYILIRDLIDIALVDANGNLDVKEIKKPFDDRILRRGLYRGNSVPTSELSGGIMQAEKYIFHLSRWGIRGEDTLTKQYSHELLSGMKIRISNPKAIIMVGRDQIDGSSMTEAQLLDFEIIKRKYANMMDIITYDDLLRRLNNTIATLGA